MKSKIMDLLSLKRQPEQSAALLRQWLRAGSAILVLCREEELDRAFGAVYRRTGDNLLLLSLEGIAPQSLYPGRVRMWRYCGGDFIPCPERETAQSQPEHTWGFLLYLSSGESTSLLLAPGLFAAMLPHGMRVHGHVRYEGRYLFFLFPSWRYTGARVRIDVGDNGCTASVPALPVMARQIEQYRRQGCAVELRYPPLCRFYELYSLLLSGAKHTVADLDAKRRSLAQLAREEAARVENYRQTLDFAWTQSVYVSAYHHCHMIREILGMSGLDDREETYERLWNEFRPPAGLLSGRMEDRLDELRQTCRAIVAVQLSCFTDFEHIHDDDGILRHWPESEQRALVHGLRKRGLGVVCLSPRCGALEGALDCSGLNAGELAGVILRAGLVVGIDHFCCQLAGILGVPSLSIYRGRVPTIALSPNGGRELCFRPVARNVCLIQRPGASVGATTAKTLDKVEDFFDGRWPVGEGLLRYEDTARGRGIDWVDDAKGAGHA